MLKSNQAYDEQKFKSRKAGMSAQGTHTPGLKTIFFLLPFLLLATMAFVFLFRAGTAALGKEDGYLFGFAYCWLAWFICVPLVWGAPVCALDFPMCGQISPRYLPGAPGLPRRCFWCSRS